MDKQFPWLALKHISKKQLLRAEWYKVLKIIHYRISPAKQIEVETSILDIKFPDFSRWRAIYEKAC